MGTTEAAMTRDQEASDAAEGAPRADVYRAARQDKPWGYELIFAAVSGKYVGKVIQLKTEADPAKPVR
jgi:hypothetical protein